MKIEELVNEYLKEHRHDVLLNPYDGLIEFAEFFLSEMMNGAVEDWAKDGVEIHSTIVEKIGGIDIVECPVNAFYEGQKVRIIIVNEE